VKHKPEVVWEFHEGGITDLQSFNKLQVNINIKIYLLLTTQYAVKPIGDEKNENHQLSDIAFK